MSSKSWYSVLGLVLFFVSTNGLIDIDAQTDLIEEEIDSGKYYNSHGTRATCGLLGIRDDTSPSDPYLLALPFDDNMPSNTIAWERTTFGNIYAVRVEITPQSPYLTARFSTTSKFYRILGNDKTQNFVREQKTREMVRNITLVCDNSSGTFARYYLKIKFQDMTPPIFGEDEYTFDITPDWNLDRPISDGQFVIVSDNAVELEENLDLKFISSQDIIKVVAQKLWVLPNPSRYYFRLDVHLTEKLDAGKNVQLLLSAFDEFTGGTTKINVRVAG